MSNSSAKNPPKRPVKRTARPQNAQTPRGKAAASSNQGPSPARDAAARLLGRILRDRAYIDDAEAAEARRINALSQPDRALAKRILLTMLRRLGEIDEIIEDHLEHPLPDEAREIQNVLRVLTAESVFLEAPPHAAVGEAVTLAKRAEPRFGGLVNAIGRKIANAGEALRLPDDSAVLKNTPAWLIEQMRADWGEAAAEKIGAGHLRGALLDLTPKKKRAADALANVVGGVVTPTGSVRLDHRGPIQSVPGYAEGFWWVQDAAAAIPAQILEPAKGERVLDLCAAPGGKTMQLAAAGAQVTALDISEKRMGRVRENLERVGLNAEILVADALEWRPVDGALFDAVLLDAPCTATGTIRRHPELPHIKDLTALHDLTALQDALLDAAWSFVRPGGRLIFCTCSLLRAEGEDRLKSALARWEDAAVSPIAPELVGLSAQSAANQNDDPLPNPARIAQFNQLERGVFRSTPAAWPRHGGVDGFFAAKLVKTESR